jgi:hypothetical protein
LELTASTPERTGTHSQSVDAALVGVTRADSCADAARLRPLVATAGKPERVIENPVEAVSYHAIRRCHRTPRVHTCADAIRLSGHSVRIGFCHCCFIATHVIAAAAHLRVPFADTIANARAAHRGRVVSCRSRVRPWRILRGARLWLRLWRQVQKLVSVGVWLLPDRLVIYGPVPQVACWAKLVQRAVAHR